MKTEKDLEKAVLKIGMNWSELLPMYANIYASLNQNGKLQVQKELQRLGSFVDLINENQNKQ